MSDRLYDLGTTRMGNARVETVMRATDEGQVLQPEIGKDRGIQHQVYKAVTGVADVDPYNVRPLRDKVFGKVIEMFTPPPLNEDGEPSTLLMPENTKPMMRHRMVTKEGDVFLFQQGYGDLMRMGSVSTPEEWLVIEPKYIMGRVLGHMITPMNGYVYLEPRVLSLVDPLEPKALWTPEPEHVRAQLWATGAIVAGVENVHESLKEDLRADVAFYWTQHLTEVVVRDRVFHAVHYNHLFGVYTP